MKEAFMRRMAFAGGALYVAVSPAAYAHTGLGEGALAGILHPLLGWDHVLAMLAVGAWSSMLVHRARWLVPAVFAAVLVLAAQFSVNGIHLPLLEAGIAASLLLAGLLVGARAHVGTAAAAVVVGMFAVVHGLTHAAEMPALASPWPFTFGLSLSTLGLQAAGMAFGYALAPTRAGMPVAGAVLLSSGGYGMAALL